MKIRIWKYQGVRVWKPDTAEGHLMEMILARDGGCVCCGRTPQDVEDDKAQGDRGNWLTIAHFHSRVWLLGWLYYWNVVVLCMSCHTGYYGWEHDKPGAHREYLLGKYGPEFMEALDAHCRRGARITKKVEVIAAFMEEYKVWKKTGACPPRPQPV